MKNTTKRRDALINYLRLRSFDPPPSDPRADRNADLEGANLTGPNLEGAFLSGPNLRFAKLERADLRGANLSVAYLGGTWESSRACLTSG